MSFPQVLLQNTVNEGNHHPHVPEEQANLFSAPDSGATEIEYLTLLYAFARCMKPRHVLETGTYRGHGTLAIAQALQDNNVEAEFSTVERSASMLAQARQMVNGQNCGALVRWFEANSLDFIKEYEGPQFEFVFLDSDTDVRAAELQLLLERDLLQEGCIVCVHDTSRLREKSQPSFVNTPMIKALDEIEFDEDNNFGLHGAFEFPFSRGLRAFMFGNPSALVGIGGATARKRKA